MTCIPTTVAEELVQSILADRLVVFCGAGLSMAKPSLLPSAVALARLCYDAYEPLAPPEFEPGLRDDLTGLVEYFVTRKSLQTCFL